MIDLEGFVDLIPDGLVWRDLLTITRWIETEGFDRLSPYRLEAENLVDYHQIDWMRGIC